MVDVDYVVCELLLDQRI